MAREVEEENSGAKRSEIKTNVDIISILIAPKTMISMNNTKRGAVSSGLDSGHL